MLISFNPPLSETVSFAPSTVLPHKQATPFLFTAQISVADYAQIVDDGGHLELWSDIPREGAYNGTWVESKFLEESALNESHSGAYTLSFRAAPPTLDSQVTKLYLRVVLPPLKDESQRFSFTYRIVYSSGLTTWLGAFGQNGSLIVHDPHPGTLKGISLLDTWFLDTAKQTYTQIIEAESHAVEVMKLDNPAGFQIFALGRERFVEGTKNVSVAILVPIIPAQATAFFPTYIMAASHEVTLSISIDGSMEASGIGNISLYVNDPLRDPKTLFQEIFCFSELHLWNVLGSDTARQVIALSSPGSVAPVHAVIIPLWSSDHSVPLLEVESSLLAQAIAETGQKEFAVMPKKQSQIYIFDSQAATWNKKQVVQVQFDHPGTAFIVTPIHRLQPSKVEHLSNRRWGAAILVPHRIAAPSPTSHENTLPTPPPSPPSSRAPLIPPQLPLDCTDSPILTSLSENATSSIPNPDQHDQNVREPSQESIVISDQPEAKSGPNPAVGSSQGLTYLAHRHRHVWVFKYLFVSLSTFMRLLFGHFMRPHWATFPKDGKPSHSPAASGPPINGANENPIIDSDMNHSEDQLTAPVNVSDEVRSLAEEQTSPDPDATAKTQSTDIHSEDSGLAALDTVANPVYENFDPIPSFPTTVVPKGPQSFFAELLLPVVGHDETEAVSVDIVLLPLPPLDATGENINEVAAFPEASISLLKTAFEGVVTFVDERGPLTRSVTQLQSNFVSSQHAEHSSPTSFTSYLVRYELGWASQNGVETISISPPLEANDSSTFPKIYSQALSLTSYM